MEDKEGYRDGKTEREREGTEAEQFLHGAEGAARLEASDAGSRPAAVTDLPGRQPDYCTEPPWTMDALPSLSVCRVDFER